MQRRAKGVAVRGHSRTSAARRAGRALAVGLVLATTTVACGDEGSGSNGLRSEPTAGSWRTWVLTSPRDIAVPPPPEEGSARAEADLDEVEKAADARTPEVLNTINKWSPPLPTDPWMAQAFEIGRAHV
jgi:hypothetical protein